jgi:hypothetical protein
MKAADLNEIKSVPYNKPLHNKKIKKLAGENRLKNRPVVFSGLVQISPEHIFPFLLRY